MKANEIHPCDGCGQSLCKHGMMSFTVVRASTAVIDRQAFNTTMGLNQMFGGAMDLAEVMSPDPEIVKIVGDQRGQKWNQYLLCLDCYSHKSLAELAGLMEEKGGDRQEELSET